MFRILVVDDTRSVQAFLRSLLGKVEGISVTPAMNGSEAVELLESGRDFDLIFLDWEMPVLNGPDTFKKLKDLKVVTPVIMMTTKNAPEDIQKMLEAGVSEYLMKPFTVDILFEKISFATGMDFNHAA